MMKLRIVAAVSALWAATCAGCLERVEHLTIRPDGSVHIELTYASESPTDIYEGDAVPTAGSGWLVEERTRERDAKRQYELHAVLVVDADSPLPSNYAGSGEAASSPALRFPTELSIEQRGDGTYYHFHRTYEPRRWAYIDLKRSELIDEPLKTLEGKDESELTDGERTKLLRGFAAFEVEKTLVFAREAHLDAAPEMPQDWWLAFAEDMRGIADEMDFTRLIELTRDPEDVERGDKFEAEMARWQAEIQARLEKSARERLNYAPRQLNRFLAVYALQQAEFAVSEDLGDDVFKITVEMPGEIVASNAGGVSGSAAQWQFSGQQLRDNSIELLVTSAVRE
jgi:hypothetical protein